MRLLSLALLVVAAPAVAQDAGVRVYTDTLKATVWIRSERGSVLATGTGSLIDRERHLILTNYHVVGNVDRATVFFPAYRDGSARPVAEKEYYEQRARQLGVRGRVVARDTKADLALIQIDSVPDAAQALTLSSESPSPGQPVHSIGNPGRSGALWVYTPGKVRQVYDKRWKAKLDTGIVEFHARVVETDSQTNAGDSGGPMVNDKGELVAVTEGGATDAQALSLFIDVSEVKRLLHTQAVRDLAVMGKATRREPKAVRDEAKFFSAEAIAKANEAIRQIAHRHGRDLLVETYATVPEGDADKVKSGGRERNVYFRDWAAKRERAEKVNGVVVLICKSPPHLYVDVSEGATALISRDEFEAIKKNLLKRFGAKEYDAALADLTREVGTALGDRRP